MENFSPRVLDNLAITWDAIHARNPPSSIGTGQDWADEILVARGVAAARVVDGVGVPANPQARARHFVERIDHRTLGHDEVHGVPFRLASPRSRARGSGARHRCSASTTTRSSGDSSG